MVSAVENSSTEPVNAEIVADVEKNQEQGKANPDSKPDKSIIGAPSGVVNTAGTLFGRLNNEKGTKISITKYIDREQVRKKIIENIRENILRLKSVSDNQGKSTLTLPVAVIGASENKPAPDAKKV